MKVEKGTVTLNAKQADGNTKEYTAPVEYLQFDTFQELERYVTAQTAGGIAENEDQVKERLKEIVKAVNYAFSLTARAAVRQDLDRKIQGPDKSINKMVDEFVKARKAQGKTVTDKLVAAFRASLIASTQADEDEAEENAA